jgi:hypothetical protein
MRTEMVEARSVYDAHELCPWAAIIISVDNGWMCFESVDDYNTWAMQA